ncbi:MAG: hypothetical protein M5U13_11240 [Thermoanaerobaculia bacterium]|nr:hypothetical protein [Thermoanaerobaculia bacterium]
MDDLEREIRRIAPAVLRFAVGVAGDREVGADAAQEALAALVQRWRRHGPPAEPEAFALAIARRRARRSLFRRALAGSRVADPEALGLQAFAVAARGEERIALAETLAHLRRLPRRDREALLVVAAGDLSAAEAARVLGLRPATLRMRLHRARTRLRALLEVRP